MSNIKSYDSLSALYNDNEDAQSIYQQIDFTIHRIQEVHAKPVQSPVFRANDDVNKLINSTRHW